MKIVLICPSSQSFELIRAVTQSNKEEYCSAHGIKFVPIDYPEAMNDKGYGRPQFMLDHLDEGDWLLNMDCDAIFMDMTRDIREFCTEAADLVCSWDCMGFHSGVMLLRNCPQIRQLLELTIKAKETDGKLPNFMASSDQGAMVRILSERDTYENNIPVADCQKFGVRVVEASKTINRYYGDWHDGDFIFHTPGMGIPEKVGLLNHWLRKVKR